MEPAPVIRALEADDIETVVEFGLRAWTPVFEAWEEILGHALFAHMFPDWRAHQAASIREACRDHESWVIENASKVAGYVTIRVDAEKREGQIYMIAVDPDHQRHGLARALIVFAEDRLRAAGAERVVIGTGGDPGHAPARALYEKSGYTGLPAAYYYRLL